MTAQWSSEILNSLIAPGYCEFTQAVVPPVASAFPQAQHWLSNLFLNSAVRAQYEPEIRSAAIGFLRRVQSAIGYYERALQLSAKYVADPHNFRAKVRPYYELVSAWESTVLQIQFALSLIKLIAKVKVFKEGDGSVEERVWELANTIKHAGERREILPLWLSNSGLCSGKCEVSYVEIAELLKSLASAADLLDDPLDARFTGKGS